MPSPFSCSPVIREWSWKKSLIEKKIDIEIISSLVLDVNYNQNMTIKLMVLMKT